MIINLLPVNYISFSVGLMAKSCCYSGQSVTAKSQSRVVKQIFTRFLVFYIFDKYLGQIRNNYIFIYIL